MIKKIIEQTFSLSINYEKYKQHEIHFLSESEQDALVLFVNLRLHLSRK